MSPWVDLSNFPPISNRHLLFKNSKHLAADEFFLRNKKKKLVIVTFRVYLLAVFNREAPVKTLNGSLKAKGPCKTCYTNVHLRLCICSFVNQIF